MVWESNLGRTRVIRGGQRGWIFFKPPTLTAWNFDANWPKKYREIEENLLDKQIHHLGIHYLVIALYAKQKIVSGYLSTSNISI